MTISAKRLLSGRFWAAAIPIAALATVYWPALGAWFQQDDFAWLGLLQRLNEGVSLTEALFAPMAQGTVRTISERLYFMVLRSIFDLNAIPFHVVTFATQIANLVLLARIVTRMTGSARVAALTGVLWTTHSCLAWPLTWAAAFNQVLCAFVFLACVNAFDRYGETNRRRWLAVVCLVFGLGFGVNEAVVALPAILILYAFLFHRSLVRIPCWLLIGSGIFALYHNAVSPKTSGGLYGIAVDGRLAVTAWSYWRFATLPLQFLIEHRWWPTALERLVGPLSVVLAAGFVWQGYRFNRAVLLGLAWYWVALSPYLVIPNHVSDYYLFVPLIGYSIAMAGLAMAAWDELRWGRLALMAVVGVVIAVQGAAGNLRSSRAAGDSRQVSFLVNAMKEATKRNPGKTIYLSGVSDQLFWNGFYDYPFYLIGQNRVYLTPGNARELAATERMSDFSAYSQPNPIVLRELAARRAVAYRVLPSKLQNITEEEIRGLQEGGAEAEVPGIIPISAPEYAYLLSGEWHEPEAAFRWMGKQAMVQMKAPSGKEQSLALTGFCTAAQIEGGPLVLTIRIDEVEVGSWTIRDCAEPIRVTAALPTVTRGRRSMDVALMVNHTVQVGQDTRRLGMGVAGIAVQ